MMPSFGRAACALVFTTALWAPASAQTNERLHANLDFRFSTPGARSVGMGRSFVGLADDATAADVNPAGIVNLRETEVAMSYTVTAYQRDYFGVPPLQTSNVVQAPSFLSLVVPAGRWRFSAFQNTTQRFRDEYCVDQVDSAATGNTSIDLTNFGGAIAFEARRVSVGISMAASSLDLAMHGRSHPGRRCTDVPLTEKNGTDTFASGMRPKAVVGMQWWVTDRLAVGGSFQPRVNFAAGTRLTGCFADATRNDASCRNLHEANRSGEVLDTDFVVPTRMAVGLGWVVTDAVVLVADWQYVRYSERITSNFRVIDFRDAYTAGNFYLNDANELHVGAEFRQVRPGRVLAARVGAFLDPDHALHFRTVPGADGTCEVADGLQVGQGDYFALTRFNQDCANRMGVSGGVGGAWKGRVQVDLGMSYVRDAFDLVVSAVLRLP